MKEDISKLQSILGACIQDADAARYVLGHIRPEMVSEPYKGICEAVARVLETGRPISLSVVRNELAIAGIVGLDEILSRMAASVDYLGYRMAAQLYAESWMNDRMAKIMEDAAAKYRRTGESIDPAAVSKDMYSIELQTSAHRRKIEDMEARRFTVGNVPAPDKVVVSVDGQPVGRTGNIMVIEGPEKSGKSSIVAAIIAGMITDISPEENLGLRVARCSGKALILADTEQSAADFYDAMLRAIKVAGLDKEPDWLNALSLNGLDSGQKLSYLKLAIKYYAEKHGGIEAIIIDGGADVIKSINSEEESTALVAFIEQAARQYSTMVCVIMHRNQKGEARGWLGSQLSRKAGGFISVSIDEDTGISEYRLRKMRKGAPVAAKEFRFSVEKQRHVLVPKIPGASSAAAPWSPSRQRKFAPKQQQAFQPPPQDDDVPF